MNARIRRAAILAASAASFIHVPAFTTLPGFGAGRYTLFDGNSPIMGSLDGNPANLTGVIGGGFSGTLALQDGGNDLVLIVVPEPGSATPLLGGLASVIGMRRILRNQ